MTIPQTVGLRLSLIGTNNTRNGAFWLKADGMKYQDFIYSIAPGILIAFASVIGYQKFDMPLWTAMTGMAISVLVVTILFLRRMR